MENFRPNYAQMFLDPSTEVVRGAMTRALARGAARAVNVNGLALAGVSLPEAGPAPPSFLDGLQPMGWGGPREVEYALPGASGDPACGRCSIISVDDSPRLVWEDLWTE